MLTEEKKKVAPVGLMITRSIRSRRASANNFDSYRLNTSVQSHVAFDLSSEMSPDEENQTSSELFKNDLKSNPLGVGLHDGRNAASIGESMESSPARPSPKNDKVYTNKLEEIYQKKLQGMTSADVLRSFKKTKAHSDDLVQDGKALKNNTGPTEAELEIERKKKAIAKELALEISNHHIFNAEKKTMELLSTCRDDEAPIFSDETVDGSLHDKATPKECHEVEDLNQIIESDNIRELQLETMMMAEQFKQNSAFVESVEDLEAIADERAGINLERDGNSWNDSNEAATPKSAIAAENDGNDFNLPYDRMLRVYSPESRSAASPSVSNHSIISEESEGHSMQQHAGEPSSDCVSHPSRSNDDAISDRTANNDFTIEGWRPSSNMETLLADFVESLSGSSSPDESSAESISSMEVAETPSGVKNPMVTAEVERLLYESNYDGVKDIVENFGEDSAEEENGISKIAAKRKKKRELEALSQAFRRSNP